MRKNPQVDDKLDREREQHLRDISQIEQKLRGWNFGNQADTTSVADNLKLEHDVRTVLSERDADMLFVEAEKLLEAMVLKRNQALKQLELANNSIIVADNEIQNKLIHRLDAEDIKYSVFKKILWQKKVVLYQENADTYQGIVDSLKGLAELKAAEMGQKNYISISKILRSTFYEAKVKARICYENFYTKLMNLSKEIAFPATFNSDIIREFEMQKMIASRTASYTNGTLVH